MFLLRSRIPATSSPICGYIIGSPPQMETIGAPHSSTAAKHSSSGTRWVMVDSYSRMRPQPVQVRLQAWSGSSINTIGNRSALVSFFLTRYPAIRDDIFKGNRMPLDLLCGEPTRSPIPHLFGKHGYGVRGMV